MTARDITAIILANRCLNYGSIFNSHYINDHPLFLPAGSKLAVELLLDFYQKDCNVLISTDVIHKHEERVPSYEAFNNANLIQIENKNDICEVILELLENITTNWVLINPIYSLPVQPPSQKLSIQIGEKLLYQDEWPGFTMDDDGNYTLMNQEDKSNELKRSFPIINIVTSPVSVLKDIIYHQSSKKRNSIHWICESLLNQYSSQIVKKVPWYNLVDKSTATYSKRLLLPSRNANNLFYDDIKDIIIKKSTNKKRLDDEKAYFRNLPTSVSYFFPRMLEPGESQEESFLLESIPYPSLSEVFLHWDIGNNNWEKIFDRIIFILNELKNSRPIELGSTSWLFSDKLKARWKYLLKSNNKYLEKWLSSEIRINGEVVPSLSTIIEYILPELSVLEKSSQIQLIHGDLCFNNILCSPFYSSIKLIDPRGELPVNSTLAVGSGDSRYDLIKLNHSINGNYDSIVSNLYEIKYTESDIQLDVYIPKVKPIVSSLFQEKMTCSIAHEELNLLTASLFFSMLPIHSDDHRRQLALTATGALILKSCLK